MRLLLDARKIEDYGIGVYIRQVFGRLIEPDFEDVRVIHLKGKDRLAIDQEREILTHYPNYDWREQLEIPWKCRRFKNYYYFSPHYVYPLFIRQKLVVTVHDLIHFIFPSFFGPKVKVEAARFFLQHVKERAELVFAVSRRTAEDLNEMFSISMDKIRIIYNGIAEEFFSSPPSISPLPFPYILYVGNWKPHKNLKVLLQAFKRIAARYSDLRLLFVGIREDSPLQKEVSELQLERKCLLLGFQPQEKIIPYLDGALFFVFPSLYEGFGLPPLEAMARGRAVLSSPAGSLSEILGGAALYFEPTSVDDLVAKMELILSDEEKRRFYEEKGRERSRLFRWEKAVDQYLHFLQALN